MTAAVEIRAPKPEDVDALVALLNQLGYPVTRAIVDRQMMSMASDSRVCVLVAANKDDVVGVVTGQMLLMLQEAHSLAMLTALVVRDDRRGSGIGRVLVEAIEAWARREGANRIIVTSGLARIDAHSFYERLGYEHTARRFSRSL